MTDFKDVLKLPECTTVLDQHLAEEIKVVKHARDFALARAKADEEYAKKLFALNTKFGKIQVTEEYEKSPIWKVWEQTWKSSDDYAAHLADKSGDAQQSVQDQLTPLIDMKEAGRTNFVATRKRIDGALAKSQKELDDKEKKYMAAVKKMDTVIDKFEIAREKGGKALNAIVEKRYKTTNDAQVTHNAYVLALAMMKEHQDLAYRNTIPKLLGGLYEVQKHHVRDFQAAMPQFYEAVDHTAAPYGEMQKAVMDEVGNLDGAKEYEPFLEQFADIYFAEPPPPPDFEPLPTIEETEPDSNQVNPLFYGVVAYFADIEQALEDSMMFFEDEAAAKKADLEDAKRELNDTKKEAGIIDDRKPVTSTDHFIQREEQVKIKRDINALEVEIFEIEAEMKMNEKQIKLIQDQKDKNQSNAPVYHDEEFFNDLVRGRSNATPKGGGRRPSSAGGGSRPPARPPSKSPGRGGGGASSRPAMPPPQEEGGGRVDPLSLEEQGYFHGKISRSEVNPLLKKVGDYLVRESAKKPGELALSVKTSEKVTHFIIQQDVPGKFRFEGEAKDSVDDLINYYKSTDMSVTKRSEAKLKSAVNRHGFDDSGTGDTFAMSHRDVKIGKKLGNGNFGEVKLGTIVATGVSCAVKTCKDTVPDPGRFLEEADTLKDYDHPNIVKLIGVVSTKPIYIILELCKDELLAYIRKHGNLLEVGTFVRMSSEAAEGMNYLHGKGCIHRDLAARNCLIGNDGAVKISDFGMSRMTEGDDEIYTVNTTAKQIPIKWTAPEALTHMTYVLATDVWAFGILLWEIFSCGKMPYPGMNNSETKEAVINQGYRMDAPAGTPDQVQQLMDECWQHNEQDRPTMADIVDYFAELKAFYPDEATSM